jgi:Arc/MetJ-type ribon-helix-helix transcriptional regulator
MRATQQLSVTLPNDMAELLKAKLENGEYASESEAIRGGLRPLIERDQALGNWLHTKVGSAYDALKADPGRVLTIEQVRVRFAQEHEKALVRA